jgi:arrestin-related trafficking adapter 4/5/7
VIGLRNLDGHVSEIRASLPVALVLPPYISSTGTAPHLDDTTINHIAHLDVNDALPTYESRIYDRLWDGVSYGGLATSALNTPATMSRRVSGENLRELNQTSMPSPVEIEASLRQAMQEQDDEEPQLGSSSRAHSSESLNIITSESGVTTPLPSAPFMQAQDSQQSSPVTITIAQTDDEEHTRLSPTPSLEMQHISRIQSDASSSTVSLPLSNGFLDISRLSRVPSYRTANSSNVLNFDPSTHSLPTYTSLEVQPERPRSRSRSRTRAGPTESTSQSPTGRFLRPPSPACGTSSGDADSGFQNGNYISQTLDCLTRI